MTEGRQPETAGEDAAAAASERPETPSEPAASPPEPEPTQAEPPHPEPALWSRRPSASGWLAAILVLVVVGIAASPFWALPLARLLPWAPPPAGSNAALAARVAATERAEAGMRADLAAVKTAQEALRGQFRRLAGGGKGNGASAAAMAQLQTRLGKIEKSVQALVAQAASRPAIDPDRIDKMQQQVARLGTLSAGLAARLPAIEHQLHAQEGVRRNDAALLTALLQMRGAVEAGRPFAAAYNAFATLGRDRPALLDAARPLAEAARDGVADTATLKRRLDTLAADFAHGAAPPPATNWRAQAWRRLRSLVTIRRIGAPPGSPGAAAVARAQAALGQGDLAGAVAALGTLSGAAAGRAEPWLILARRRLTAEAALDRVQQQLLADLSGARPAAPAETTATPAAPGKPGAPS